MQVDDAALGRDYGGSCSIIDSELGKNVLHVSLNSLFANVQGGGDLFVAKAVCHKLHDFHFAR